MPGRKSVKDHCVLFQPSGGISLCQIKKVVTKSRGFVISKKKRKKTRPAVNMSSMLRRANLVLCNSKNIQCTGEA